MTSTYVKNTSGVVANTEFTLLKATSAQNPTGFNTLYVWGTWGGGTAYLECSPDFDPNNPGAANWFDVDGTNSQLSQNTKIDFQTRAAAFRLRNSGVTILNFAIL